MQQFRHCSHDLASTVVFFLRIFSVLDFLLAHYNNPVCWRVSSSYRFSATTPDCTIVLYRLLLYRFCRECLSYPRRIWTTASMRPPLDIRRMQLSKIMSPHNHRTDKPRYKDAFSSGRAVIPTIENQGLSVLQLNAEGLTNAKLKVIRQVADSNQVAVVLLHETHRTSDDNLKLQGFSSLGLSPVNITEWQHSSEQVLPGQPLNDLQQTQTSSGWSQRSKKQL